MQECHENGSIGMSLAPKWIDLETCLGEIVTLLGDDEVGLKDRLESASEMARTALSPEAAAERRAWLRRTMETGLRWQILESLASMASFEKYRDNRSSREIGYEVTALSLEGLTLTSDLTEQNDYGALGQDLKITLASTFEKLRGVLLEGRGGLNSWKERVKAAEEIAQDVLGVIRPLVLTLHLVDTVNTSNRPIIDEAIGRGMFVQRIVPDGDYASEPSVFSIFGGSGAYVADERGIFYSEADFDEAAELIFDGKELADLKPVMKIEFDCLAAEREISYRRQQSKLN